MAPPVRFAEVNRCGADTDRVTESFQLLWLPLLRMGRGKNITCASCQQVNVRVSNMPMGCVQRCPCGHILDGRPVTPKPRVAKPRGTASLSSGGGGQSLWRGARSSSRQPSTTSSVVDGGDLVSSDEADPNVIRPMDKPPRRSPNPQGGSHSGVIPANPRAAAASEIQRLESSLAVLDPEADGVIVASLNAKIAEAKSRVILAKPLDQQIKGLEAYLTRKRSKVSALKESLVQSHKTLVLVSADVVSKETQLEGLRAQLASQTQPELVAQANRATSQQSQLASLQEVVSLLVGALQQHSVPLPDSVRNLVPTAGPAESSTTTLDPLCNFALVGNSSFGARLPALPHTRMQPYPDSCPVLGGFMKGHDVALGSAAGFCEDTPIVSPTTPVPVVTEVPSDDEVTLALQTAAALQQEAATVDEPMAPLGAADNATVSS